MFADLNTIRRLRQWLHLAAAYHLLWAAFMILWPTALFRWGGMALPTYPLLIQGLGAGIGVYGLAFWVAARAPLRHWLVVLMATLLKGAAVLGMSYYLLAGVLPPVGWGFTLVNDLFWLFPFGWYLAQVYGAAERVAYPVDRQGQVLDAAALRAFPDQYGQNLYDASFGRGELVVFLRHFGCTFCREALADLARQRAELERQGLRLVLVHLSSEEKAARFIGRYGLGDLPRIANPTQELYQAFDLPRGSWKQVFGWKSWLRGFLAGVIGGHGIGWQEGDGWQMPGIFLLRDGQLVQGYRHRSAGDKPEVCVVAAEAAPLAS
jgi:peroxiredoxin